MSPLVPLATCCLLVLSTTMVGCDSSDDDDDALTAGSVADPGGPSPQTTGDEPPGAEPDADGDGTPLFDPDTDDWTFSTGRLRITAGDGSSLLLDAGAASMGNVRVSVDDGSGDVAEFTEPWTHRLDTLGARPDSDEGG